MKKIISITLLIFSIYSFSFAQNEAPFFKNSDEFKMVPGFKKGYKPQIGLALIGGIQKNYGLTSLNEFGADARNHTLGLEVSLQCPLMCTKKNYIRQQVTVLYSAGDFINSLAIEINPHYRFLVTPTFELAAGPGFGLNFAQLNGTNHFNQEILTNGENVRYNGIDSKSTVFTYGLGGSATFHLGRFFIGLETRYYLSTKGTFDLFSVENTVTNIGNDNPFTTEPLDFDSSNNTYSIKDNLNNIRTALKIGYKF